jgi:hypothetical protein
MTSLFAQRRAAEEFAKLVDAPQPRHRDTPDADLLATVELLRAHTSVTPRAEFVTDLRARLMAAADTALAPAPDLERAPVGTPGRRASHRFGTAAAAALVVVGGSAGLAAASQGALPGETLYPVKRGIEAAATAFNTSDAGRGTDLLANASTRLQEAESLAADGAPAERVDAALSDFVEQADKGSGLLFTSYQSSGDTRDIRQVQEFAGRSSGVLDSLAESGPGESADSVARAQQTVADIATQARTLCAACGDVLELTRGAIAAPGQGVEQLIGDTVRDAGVREEQLEQLGKLAAGAQAQADQAPPPATGQTSTGSAGSGSTPSGQAPEGTVTPDGTTVPDDQPTGQLPGAEQLPKVTAPVKNTIEGTTDGVTGLIREITKTTPLSPLAPVTDPVTKTVDDTVQGLLGLLP